MWVQRAESGGDMGVEMEGSLLGGVPQMAAQMSAYAKERCGYTSVRDQVVPVLCLFQTAKCHLGAGDVFLGVLEVFELYE